MDWTRDQRTAFSYRGGRLLVSAAAGSGKTAVLVERILSRVLDGKDPQDITSFLVVTFTKAAAGEMKEKIRQKFNDKLAADPDDRRLPRQLALLPSADIGTVHSFCYSLVSRHFQALGLPANLRIGGEVERELLAQKAMEQVLEQAFESDDEDFLAMLDQLSGTRDNGAVAALVRSCYEDLMSQPDPEGQVRRALAMYDVPAGGLSQSSWAQEVLERLRCMAQYYLARYRAVIARIEQTGVAAAYLPTLYEEASLLEPLAARGMSWDGASELLRQMAFGKLKRVNGESEEKQLTKQLRDDLKKDLESVRLGVLAETEADILAALPEQGRVARALYGLTLRFYKTFREAKLSRGILDFSDLEQEAYRLLVEGVDGEGAVRPTATAREVGARYCEIMVDEYQDTNALQDGIFLALTAERGNLFLVGDVKQSIYRFRQADPDVFLKKYRSFPPVEQPEHTTGDRRRSLSANFRSRPEVIDAVNLFFSQLCIPAFSEIEYGEEEKLRPGRKVAERDARYVTELHVVDRHADGQGELNEPDEVARRIDELLDSGLPIPRKDGTESPVTPEDVVILLRSDNGRMALYARALAQRGIACCRGAEKNLCKTLEVRTALGCLMAVHNPRNDVAMLTFLRCPALAFTALQLAAMRAVKRQGSIYESLCRAAEGDENCARALQMLTSLREQAKELPVSRLLPRLMRSLCLTDGFAAMEGGERRAENLSELWGHACAFDAAGGGSLQEFCDYVTAMDSAREKGESAAGNGVRIMSIHSSKGLEFPVVVLAAAGKQFNADDKKNAVLRHKELGIGARRRDVGKSVSFSTLPRDAIDLRTERESRAEELRVFYVALTRACEKLIVFTSPDARSSFTDRLERLRSEIALTGLSAWRLMRAGSAGEWLLMALLSASEGGLEGFGSQVQTVEAGDVLLCYHGRGQAVTVLPEGQEPSAPREREQVPAQVVADRAFAAYAHGAAVRTPSKMTVTELKGREKDEELDAPLPPPARRRPAFLGAKDGATAAERGTAVHMLLSHVDLSATDRGQLEQTLARMVREQYVTAEAGAQVDTQAVAAFFAGELGRRLCSAERVLREFKFSVLVPADEVADMGGEQGELVMLQGVADAVMDTPQGLVLLDYKTDRRLGGDAEAWRAQKVAQYRPQVEAYAAALERIFKKPVIERWLCFLSTAENVSL